MDPMTEDLAFLAPALAEVAGRLHRMIRSHLDRQRVSLATARTLATLDREGPVHMSELAAVEQVAQPTISALVARLESQGLVQRSPDPADGRLVVVALTPSGRDQLGSILELRTALVSRWLAELSSPERAAVAAAIPALVRLSQVAGEPSLVAGPR